MKSKKVKKNKFFEDLKKGLQEILDYQKGKIKLSSESIEHKKRSIKAKIERKSFQKYLEKRLNKEEIAEIEKQVKLEKKVLETLKKDISRAVNIT